MPWLLYVLALAVAAASGVLAFEGFLAAVPPEGYLGALQLLVGAGLLAAAGRGLQLLGRVGSSLDRVAESATELVESDEPTRR
ncbi:MAG TPA: hypothetical protein VLL72_04975 [Kiloniellales bacterium]|nr:hypothetical protein [Kiloniellales bacterium]